MQFEEDNNYIMFHYWFYHKLLEFIQIIMNIRLLINKKFREAKRKGWVNLRNKFASEKKSNKRQTLQFLALFACFSAYIWACCTPNERGRSWVTHRHEIFNIYSQTKEQWAFKVAPSDFLAKFSSKMRFFSKAVRDRQFLHKIE